MYNALPHLSSPNNKQKTYDGVCVFVLQNFDSNVDTLSPTIAAHPANPTFPDQICPVAVFFPKENNNKPDQIKINTQPWT
ncbi:hypothetical protein Bca101_046987 [Brassica carinata]